MKVQMIKFNAQFTTRPTATKPAKLVEYTAHALLPEGADRLLSFKAAQVPYLREFPIVDLCETHGVLTYKEAFAVVSPSTETAPKTDKVAKPKKSKGTKRLERLQAAGVAFTRAGSPNMNSLKRVGRDHGYDGPQQREALEKFCSKVGKRILKGKSTAKPQIKPQADIVSPEVAGPSDSELQAAMQVMRAWQATNG